ncbi:permease [Sulfolobus acidocaldarius SUSAZ]|nr:permease [Sulfolobus acidocaldarius SUSAZ]
MSKEDRLTANHIKLIIFNVISYTFLVYNASSVIAYTSQNLAQEIFHGLYPFSVIGIYTSLVLSYGLRIAGASLLGPLSDKLGRRVATIIGGIGSSTATALIGFLPPYTSIGIFSIILYFLLVSIQGLFTGPLSAGVQVIGVENLPERHRGWFSGIGIAVSGTAYLVAVGLSLISGSNWRFLFWGSLIMVPISLLAPESSRFRKLKEKVKSPRKIILEKYGNYLKFAFLLSFLWASVNFVIGIILPTFLSFVNNFTESEIREVILVYSLVSIVSAFVGGELSEIFGRKRLSLVGGTLGILVSPTYFLIASLNSLYYVILYISLLTFLGFLGAGGILALVNESFPTNVRGTGVSMSWNMGFFGATLVALTVVSPSSYFNVLPLGEFLALLILGSSIIAVSLFAMETRGMIDKEK